MFFLLSYRILIFILRESSVIIFTPFSSTLE